MVSTRRVHRSRFFSAAVAAGAAAAVISAGTGAASASADAPTGVTTSPTVTAVTAEATSAANYLTTDGSSLLVLPTTGSAWTTLLRVADGDLGSPNLANQDNTNAGRTVAAALVYARTGQVAYRDKAIAELRGVPTSPLTSARVLSVARQVAGYAIAADLIGYRDPSFVSFMSGIRTRYIANHGRWYNLTQTSEDTASNWGAWAMASRIAASRYVGDTTDIARAAKVFRGFLGDRSAYAGFRKTADFDPTWVCGDPALWVPINPATCGSKAGALVEDISRSGGAFPSVDNTGRTYSWETLGGATLSAQLLARAGYPDVYGWSDRAILRAAEFLQRNGGYAPLYNTNQYIPWAVNKAYKVTLGPVNPAGYGRQYGFTDWLA